MLFLIFLFLGPHAFEITLGGHLVVCQKYQQTPKGDKNQSGNRKKQPPNVKPFCYVVSF